MNQVRWGATFCAVLLALGARAQTVPSEPAGSPASSPTAGPPVEPAEPVAPLPADADAGVAATEPDAGVTPKFEPEPAAPKAAPEVRAAPAEPPPRVQFSEYLLASYHLDNGNIAPPTSFLYDPSGSNYVDWINKLQMDVSWGNLIAMMRVDSGLFINAPVAADGNTRLETLLANRYQDRVDFEKVFVSYSHRYFDVTLGDTYATYGRGLVLSLRKVDEFGIDTTVRGVSATGHVAGLTVNALGGWANIINVDPASGRRAEDPGDAIIGARAEYKIGRWVTPGIDFSHVIYGQNLTTGTQTSKDQVTSASATLELPHLWSYGNFYAEYAVQRKVTGGTEISSSAFYASGSAYLGPVTVLLEYKDYRHYSPIPTSLDPTLYPEFALTDFYTAAPTLERVQQVVLNNTDIAGPHARVSLKLIPDVTPYVSMAVFDDRIYKTRIYDPYAGAEIRWNDGASRASVSGGYRLNQYVKGSVAPNTPFQEEWHAEYDINQHIKGPYGVELSGLHLSHHDAQGPKYLDWVEGQAYLSLKRSQDWSVALGYEYYTEAPQVIRPNYFNVSGSFRILQNLTLRAFIGGQRAGIKCVNGVCRNYPAFDGARLEVLAKY